MKVYTKDGVAEMEIVKTYVICNEWHQRVKPLQGGYSTREEAQREMAGMPIANALHVVERQTPVAK